MKFNIKKPPVSRLPEVGDIWHHRGNGYVFMRVPDVQGRLATRRTLTSSKGTIFSVLVGVDETHGKPLHGYEVGRVYATSILSLTSGSHEILVNEEGAAVNVVPVT